jgi:hypothetical protein
MTEHGHMPETNDWLVVARYAEAFQAELGARILRDAGIPFRIRGDRPGVFGALLTAAGPHGFELSVPARLVEDALMLLTEIQEHDDGED